MTRVACRISELVIDAADPGIGDVRAGDRVPPACLLLVGGQVRHLPAGRPDPADDPPQAAGPVPGAAHQVRDLRDILVLLGLPVQVQMILKGVIVIAASALYLSGAGERT